MVMVIVMVVASVGFCGGGRCTVIAIMLVVSVGVVGRHVGWSPSWFVILVGHRGGVDDSGGGESTGKKKRKKKVLYVYKAFEIGKEKK